MRLTVPANRDDHVQGPEEAPFLLTEYGDYQCPHCAQAYRAVKSLQARLGHQLRFVFRHMPLTALHATAQIAAEAAEAAGAQGRFWEMHDALFMHQPELSLALIVQLAHQLKLDIDRFNADIASRRFRERVKRDFSSGAESGVKVTPTFFINGELHRGASDEQALLSALLSGKRKSA